MDSASSSFPKTRKSKKSALKSANAKKNAPRRVHFANTRKARVYVRPTNTNWYFLPESVQNHSAETAGKKNTPDIGALSLFHGQTDPGHVFSAENIQKIRRPGYRTRITPDMARHLAILAEDLQPLNDATARLRLADQYITGLVAGEPKEKRAMMRWRLLGELAKADIIPADWERRVRY
jgi:hypothetical protein